MITSEAITNEDMDELIPEDMLLERKKSLIATLNKKKISKYELDELFASEKN